MDDVLRQLKNNISNLSDDELVQMVTTDAGEYREEAVEFAREELEARGVGLAEASAGEEEPGAEEGESEAAALPGAVCFVCNGPMRRAALVGDKELIVAFRDDGEQRFVDVLVCGRCGEGRLLVDLESDVEDD